MYDLATGMWFEICKPMTIRSFQLSMQTKVCTVHVKNNYDLGSMQPIRIMIPKPCMGQGTICRI